MVDAPRGPLSPVNNQGENGEDSTIVTADNDFSTITSAGGGGGSEQGGVRTGHNIWWFWWRWVVEFAKVGEEQVIHLL